MSSLSNRIHEDIALEGGIDEAGRGCMVGRVYTACVILPDQFPDETYLLIKDSKKLSKKSRDKLRMYIEEHAVAYAVEYADIEEIESKNILHATVAAMHRCIAKMNVKPDHLAIDGNYFKPYPGISHTLVKGGDNLYRNIAAASILAKTHHDEYVIGLLDHEPDLEKYGWRKNMCYGTKQHLDAIKQYGLTPYHRRGFGICREISTGTSEPPKKKARTYNSYYQKQGDCRILSDSEEEEDTPHKPDELD